VDSTLLITVISTALAAAVEMVEAVTIVLAVGVTRQWRSTLYGVGAALVALAAVVVVFGTAIVMFVPIDALRLLIGGLLLIYGLQWLTKAILRAGGAKAMHDESAIYEREIAALQADPPMPADGLDGISFAVAFKGVFLEGLEVAFIVITFGTSAGSLGAATLGAAIAVALVLAVAIVVRRPLAGVPENQLKFAVGLMLVTFGTFWAGEGLGIEWPGADLAILALGLGYLVISAAAVRYVSLRIRRLSEPASTAGTRKATE